MRTRLFGLQEQGIAKVRLENSHIGRFTDKASDYLVGLNRQSTSDLLVYLATHGYLDGHLFRKHELHYVHKYLGICRRIMIRLLGEMAKAGAYEKVHILCILRFS